MEQYARLLMYAIPAFLVLIFIEYLVGLKMGKTPLRGFDTISSLGSGMTNVIKDVLGLTIIVISYTWMYDRIALVHLNSTFLIYAVAFIGVDFAGYWSHRIEHMVNIFWNRHIIHHSSEEFNLACALRQSISAVFAIFTILYLPMAILGVPPKVIAIVAPLHLFVQFWYHTALIKKMGVLESIIVTPSHHRVHHAINNEYLDKNFSQVFIIWDKLFGTFQAELTDVLPVYGVKRAVRTWNPIKINFQHLWLLMQDAYRAQHLVDALKIWFMPTGWRPKDVESSFPIQVTTDAYHREKYSSASSKFLLGWSWFQLSISMVLMIFLFYRLGEYSFTNLLLGGFFLFVQIYAFTSLMDKNFESIFAEAIKLTICIALTYAVGGWFGIPAFWLISYCLISLIASIYFLKFEDSLVTKFQRI